MKLHKNVKAGLIIGLVTIILFFVLNYLFLVRVNLRYGGIYILFGVVFTLGVFFAAMSDIAVSMKGNYDYTANPPSSPLFRLIGVPGILIIAFVILSFFSTPMFHADSYRELIGDVSDPLQFTVDFDAVNTEDNLPVVDSSLARQLGDKEFGQVGSLGSEFHVGEFSDLSVDGNLVAVAPLEHNGFFKWLNNRTGTPGYVVVDKFTGDVEIITGLNMKYMPSSYFGSDLHRHVYYNGENAMRYHLTDFALELDDNMNPYWVITALNPTIGLTGGEQVVGIYVVDPQTGDIDFYAPEDAPDWVDTVYPKELVLRQLNYWGAYVDGWLNSFIGQRNVIQTTNGSRRVFNDNRVYHYTGLTSASSDEATVGFVFVNTRTKDVTRYSMSGATENAAMESAEGIVQNFGYYATFPIPMNVYNQPTFMITLKDNKGLIKQYAFVNVSDFSKVGIGDSLDKAYLDYGEKLNLDEIDPDDSNIVIIQGIVDRISMSVVEGESQYEILIDGTLYTARYKLSSYLSVTQPGDEVIIQLIGDRVIGFENLDIE